MSTNLYALTAYAFCGVQITIVGVLSVYMMRLSTVYTSMKSSGSVYDNVQDLVVYVAVLIDCQQYVDNTSASHIFPRGLHEGIKDCQSRFGEIRKFLVCPFDMIEDFALRIASFLAWYPRRLASVEFKAEYRERLLNLSIRKFRGSIITLLQLVYG